MTRQIARNIVLSELGSNDVDVFDRYANDAEAFEGSEFWNGFTSRREFVDDFRLFATEVSAA